MLPQVNGKSLLACSLTDILVMIDNMDYRENAYLDFKEVFHYFAIPSDQKSARDDAKAEFRKDVCAFANADGGYLIYGVEEDDYGIPHKASGFAIKDGNTDQFEMSVRSLLQTIQPKVPTIQMHFIPVETRFIVVIYVESDGFTPYIFLEGGKNYRVYKRNGNQSTTVSYEELRIMFNQSMIMEKEVERFRQERIAFIRSQEDNESHDFSEFVMLHIIPDTFLMPSKNQKVFVMEKKGAAFRQIFDSFLRSLRSMPMVDGLRYIGEESCAECRLYNSLIAEAFAPLKPYTYDMRQSDFAGYRFLRWNFLWEDISETLADYIRVIKPIVQTKRVFVCISIIGGRGIVTDYNQMYGINLCSIDRNDLLNVPFVLENIQDEAEVDRRIKELHFEFFLALGIRYQQEFQNLYKELYAENPAD